MNRVKITAIIPNANNSMAEAVRNRTRCRICNEKIEDGQEIWAYPEGEQEHTACTEREELNATR